MEEFKSNIPKDKKHILEDLLSELELFLTGDENFKTSEWKGYKFRPGFNADTAKHAYENVVFKENSVFVDTFSKTGTNWTYEIVRQIMYGNDEKLDKISKSLSLGLMWLEMGKAEKYEIIDYIPLPRILFGSHLPEELFNLAKIKKRKGKVITVTRNPKDQAVSLFHFAQIPIFNNIRECISSNWTDFFSSYVQGKIPMITKQGEWYLDHLLGWYKHKDDEDVLFLNFENMKKDIKKEIKKIGEFVGVDLSEERIEKIAESTSFDSMKKATKIEGNEDAGAAARKRINIMRRGQVGDWKKVFTVAQSELVDKLVQEKLGHTDIKFTYEL